MSIEVKCTYRVTVTCDDHRGCLAQGPGMRPERNSRDGSSQQQAIAALRLDGWIVDGGHARCPVCRRANGENVAEAGR